MINQLSERIFLCGFMGTGKSTIGQKLSEELNIPFLDLDDVIEEEAGKSIAEIFEQDGEKEFRNIERTCLLTVIRSFEGVIALGGGTLQNQDIVEQLKQNGLLIFIESPFSVIFERISNDSDQPLTWNSSGEVKEKEILKEEMKQLYQQRLPFYRQAELHIDCSSFDSLDRLTDKLIRKIRNHVSHY